MELFGRLKGLEDCELDEAVASVIEMLSLTRFTNKLAGTLSGGNKRASSGQHMCILLVAAQLRLCSLSFCQSPLVCLSLCWLSLCLPLLVCLSARVFVCGSLSLCVSFSVLHTDRTEQASCRLALP